MNKLIEMLTDRSGKLSIYKVSFFLGANCFLIGWCIAAFSSRTVPEIPQSLSLFLGVLGSTQLGGTFLSNKREENQGDKKE